MEIEPVADDCIQESESHYQRIIEAIPDAEVVYDNRGDKLYANPLFVKAYGCSKEELLGRPLDFLPPDEWENTP